MPLSHLRILVIEDEFLIAMDAERILRDAGAEQVVLCKHREFPRVLQESRFDIVLLEVKPDTENLAEEVALISGTGAKLAFVTSDPVLLANVSEHEASLTISKPYDDRQLANLVEILAALAARKRLQGDCG